jgi:octaprenyl-diphosphate synthase
MSEGELLQIEKARRLDIQEDVYFEIIRKKTATLIASCCASGAASAGCTPEQVETMRQIGENIGIAFQIKDDLFDYESSGAIGKPTGIDIKERKMTLPLIYTLANADAKNRSKIINIVKNHNTETAKVEEVISMVKAGNGMRYAEEKMREYRDKALEMLKQFPENEYSKSFVELIRYTVDRNK